MLLLFFTLVIYEPTESTYEIEVYDYSEENVIEVICPEGTSSYECIEPRPPKTEISLDDIKNCADNWEII
ncbi:MAG: hypothetical protein CL529_12635 [Aequorivita sp.]|nr:hypothetical protein [Aequorivita sp.]|tara:strand:- start:26091 stop:26300 length:210 start_codon:yes stop_codon:yes gene_type:complete